MRKNTRRGFTLVELIIVIAVIGVLAAILIPVFTNVIRKANAKSALADARNAVSLYVTEALERRTSGDESSPEQICIIVEKGGRYYLFGFDTAVSESIQVSDANETGIDEADLNALIANHSWNSLSGSAYNPNDGNTYTLSDGAFYLVPYTGATADNTNVRGFASASSTGENYLRLDKENQGYGFDLNVGDDTAIYHGCLVNGTFSGTSTIAGDDTHSDGTPTPTPSTPPAVTTYTVTLDLNGVSVPGYQTSYSVNDGDSFTCNNPSAQGKIFDGWKKGTESVTLPITITANTTLTAQWSDVTHIITINPTWSGNDITITGIPGTFTGYTYNAPEGTDLNDIIDGLGVSTTIDGKNFLGWTINGTAYNSGVANSLTENVTIAPVFGDATYTIRFYNGSSEITALRMTNIAYNATDIALPNESTTGNYVTYGAGNHFRGWKLDNAGTAVFTYTGHVTADKSFTVSLGAYKVDFFNPNNGANLNATVKTGDTYYVPTPTLTSNMYYHSSWTVSSGAAACPVDATEYTANKDNITITAVESSKSVNVTFTVPAGASNVPASGVRTFATDGNTINLGTPTLEHHNTPVYAVTATDNANGTISGTTLTLSTDSIGSITVTLTFTADPTYTVTYNKNTEDTVTGMPENDTGLYAGTHTLSTAIPTRTGYNFMGWGETAGATSSIPSVTITNSDVTVYAIWQQESQSGEISVTFNLEFVKYSDATAHWHTEESDYLKTYTRNCVVGQNVLTVKEIMDAGSWCPNTSTSTRTFIFLPTAALSNSTIISEWNIDIAVGQTSLDMTVYARRVALPLGISYNANGGTGTLTDSNTYNYGDTATVLANTGFTRQFYVFTGWNTKSDGTGTSYSAGDTIDITGPVSLYAQWVEDTSQTLTIYFVDVTSYGANRITEFADIGYGTNGTGFPYLYLNQTKLRTIYNNQVKNLRVAVMPAAVYYSQFTYHISATNSINENFFRWDSTKLAWKLTTACSSYENGSWGDLDAMGLLLENAQSNVNWPNINTSQPSYSYVTADKMGWIYSSGGTSYMLNELLFNHNDQNNLPTELYIPVVRRSA